VIFEFAVRRLKWLAAIPGAPQIFDALLLGLTALFDRTRFRAISDIEACVRELLGVKPGVHRLGGIGFFLRGMECGHIHGNGLLDCFVGRANREALVRDGRALPHHVFPQSGWISFWIKDSDDVPGAIELIRMACAYRQQTE
jgi:luciferase-like monooxygenase